MRQDFLHLKAPENWINDPNGFIYLKATVIFFISIFPMRPCGEPCTGGTR